MRRMVGGGSYTPQRGSRLRLWEWLTRERRAMVHLPHRTRRRLWRRAFVRALCRPMSLIPALVVCIPLLLVAQWGDLLVPPVTSSQSSFKLWGGLMLLGFLVYSWTAMALVSWTWVRGAYRELARLLLAQGIRPAVCLLCGYNLRGIDGNACPECGCPLPKR